MSSIRFTVLGSGSGGNSTLVVFEGGSERRCALIDAGLSPRETQRRLSIFGYGLGDIDDLLITHLDTDHFRPTWARAAPRHGIRVHVHRRHYRRAPHQADLGSLLSPFDGAFLIHPDIHVQPIHMAHDDLGTVGYVIEHGGERLGFATDLGRVPEHLYDTFVALDYLAIESNYDRTMQIRSNRPPRLIQRIMGGGGHLSNEQSLEAVLRIAAGSFLRHVVMLHLSRQCNRPELIEDLYAQRAGSLRDHLTISSQFDPTPLLDGRARPAVHVGRPVQDVLFQQVGTSPR